MHIPFQVEGRAARGETRRGRGTLVGAVTRGPVMGGAGLRGARTDRRYTGVVDAAALASGEMNAAPLDDLGSLDARDSAQRAATHTIVFDVDVEHALEPRKWYRKSLLRPRSDAGDDHADELRGAQRIDQARGRLAATLSGIAENTGEGGMSDARHGAASQLIFQMVGGRLVDPEKAILVRAIKSIGLLSPIGVLLAGVSSGITRRRSALDRIRSLSLRSGGSKWTAVLHPCPRQPVPVPGAAERLTGTGHERVEP